MLYPSNCKVLKEHRKVAQISTLYNLAWLFKGEDIETNSKEGRERNSIVKVGI